MGVSALAPLQMIRFSGVKAGEACTIMLRGATNQLLDEAERSLHDALAVMSQTVKETKTTLGGGTVGGALVRVGVRPLRTYAQAG